MTLGLSAQLRFLGELAVRNLPFFLMGGFAEDALLEHAVIRQRADVDLLVEAKSWEAGRAQLEAIGVAGFERRFSGPDGGALAFASRDARLEVEVWLARQWPEGYAITLPGAAADGRPMYFRLLLPADTFRYPAAMLEGVAVQTISPLALCLFRAASAQTRGDAGKRREDLQIVERLARAFLRDHDPAELTPRITELG